MVDIVSSSRLGSADAVAVPFAESSVGGIVGVIVSTAVMVCEGEEGRRGSKVSD